MKIMKLLALGSLASLFLAAPALGGSHEAKQASSSMSVVAFAAHTGDFDTLLAAVETAGLTETLSSGGPFTVFAPTDAAFAKIPESDLEALLADKEELTAVLTYHVVSGRVTSEQVATLASATTLEGSSVAFETANGVQVDGATVVKADLMVSDGVIHVIDAVLMPSP
jgi:uncharacterized surface protein with fasciclin (FAS1) repeats